MHLWLTLCEATDRSTKLRKKQSYKSVLSEKKEALLLITTLPCLKVFISLITKNKSKSPWHTEKFAKKRLKEKSSGRNAYKAPKPQSVLLPALHLKFSRSLINFQLFELPQKGRVLSDRKIALQTTLSSRSQLESSAGKPDTKTRTAYNSTTGGGDEWKYNFRGPKRHLFLQNEALFKAPTGSLVCVHAKNGDTAVTITTKKQGSSAPKSLYIESDR